MSGLRLRVEEHPHLDLGALEVELPRALGELESPAWLLEHLRPDAEAPLRTDDEVKKAVRDLLRHGGYRPTGRGKPSSEYLVKAAADGRLGTINAAVDAGNAASLHSGIPISVVDAGRLVAPLSVGLGAPDAKYVFNPSGQEIDVAGLLCLHDAEGPCANAVKDAQRTKTDATTARLLVLVWGTRALGERTARTTQWLRELYTRLGTECLPVGLDPT